MLSLEMKMERQVGFEPTKGKAYRFCRPARSTTPALAQYMMGVGGIEPLTQPPHLSIMGNGFTVRREEQLPKTKKPLKAVPQGVKTSSKYVRSLDIPKRHSLTGATVIERSTKSYMYLLFHPDIVITTPWDKCKQRRKISNNYLEQSR